jgi:hypothetical protein
VLLLFFSMYLVLVLRLLLEIPAFAEMTGLFRLRLLLEIPAFAGMTGIVNVSPAQTGIFQCVQRNNNPH